MNLSTKHFITHIPLICRIILAIFGGYGVAVLVDLAFLGLPIQPLSAVFWGQIASVVAFTAMILLTFSITSLKKLLTIFGVIVLIFGMVDFFILF